MTDPTSNPNPPLPPAGDGPGPNASLDALTEQIKGLRDEFSTALPHLVSALKRQEAVQALTDRLSAAEKELAQRRATPTLLAVARALHRVRRMDLPDDARSTLEEELSQILTEGGLTEFGEVGDPFEITRHEPLDGEVGPSGHAQVSTVHATGLSMGSVVLLSAKVSIEPMPQPSQEASQ